MEPIPPIVHESWHPYISHLFELPSVKELKYNILPSVQSFPIKSDIFKVFSMPITDIKVVILGQDPYFKEGQATGYAFAVPEDMTKPPSLQVIEKEVGKPINRTLLPWVEQGVFLLNTALTVRSETPNSHTKHWRPFITEVIEVISKVTPCVWMLWGAKAHAFVPYINNVSVPEIDIKDKNVILLAAHPASEKYGNAAVKFSGCHHFRLANDILIAKGKQPIDW